MDEDLDDIRSVSREGQALLEQARSEASGRSGLTLVHGDRQRAVLMGLTAGAGMAEHDAPPAATLQVIAGRARVFVAGDSGPEWLLDEGDLLAIPRQRHGVDALSDCVLLLTVALDS